MTHSHGARDRRSSRPSSATSSWLALPSRTGGRARPSRSVLRRGLVGHVRRVGDRPVGCPHRHHAQRARRATASATLPISTRLASVRPRVPRTIRSHGDSSATRRISVTGFPSANRISEGVPRSSAWSRRSLSSSAARSTGGASAAGSSADPPKPRSAGPTTWRTIRRAP